MTKQIKIPMSTLMIHVAVLPVQVKKRKVSAAIAITCTLEESLFHVQIPEQKKKWKKYSGSLFVLRKAEPRGMGRWWKGCLLDI